ncbi:MAG TPA: polyribonucleotide nucleotidyltransferase [Persephonella sp.]|uniref:Polyribonucleotide nucleotidyltransferase n=1 Tax=Persephonella marina (strain DSM 14350 / EX-H1) TaxID=123214 RepID=PNP_PERMH|nr:MULTISPECIES: polyribonucleotide nucleotidyltransferase [Persephonella]C0QTM3.1 RecName: Full=Polyribonucleotide nucleotidyltransferase; AltName: Full=Polynucleotide phosphorylase; Short=PNPase [Persephonella marina EX-H1]ACO04247.1 polyribonucleotide nucleotidyltransferase [Persephonella marina EX-H1]HCB70346.1 polyribonucleotide nucleotidyltransferase [Persephonella sp.]
MEGIGDITVEKVETKIQETPISIETGYFAKQSNGAVIVRQGETAVFVAAVISEEAQADIDFLPLTVDYREKTYAYGKIPGGFVKREGKPTVREILVSRLIDRPIRPMFPKGFFNDVIITAMTLSADDKYDPDVLAIVGASAALHITEAPFEGPVAGVRVCRLDGEFIVNPTYEQRNRSDIDIVVAGTKDAIVMVEGGSEEVSEEVILDAILFAHEEIKKLCDLQEELRSKVGKEKITVEIDEEDERIKAELESIVRESVKEAFNILDKKERNKRIKEIYEEAIQKIEIPEEKEKKAEVIYKEIVSNIMREKVLKEKVRIDGRRPDEIRPIWIRTGLFPRIHGSAIFTRGQTQAFVATTLGAPGEEQIEESIEEGEEKKRFMLHYNFPPFSTGEARPPRAPSRREIGHGNLAERAIEPLIPDEEEFPYVIRVVSEILESNGSTSMATVCGASLSLFDAGVPMKKHVAGIAMGLLKEDDDYVILTDILGDEDHLGDMDFKVAGTRDGVTSIQMDIKIKGLSKEILQEALEQAKKARMHILDLMYKAMPQPRPELSPHAPKVITMRVLPEKIPVIIGPSGKNIKKIIDETGVKIDLDQEGLVRIYAVDGESADKAKEMIERLIMDIELGEVYMGKVTRVEDYGAFVELMPGKLSLLHVSQISPERIRSAKEKIKVGDILTVKVIDIDEMGRAKVSLKEVREGEEPKNKFLFE